ncbi:Nn.00g083990.m01.CDS01 [Neocucurbitaria sp. VM-36]
MAAAATSPPLSTPLPTLFNGRDGTNAPFKADYVSSLISTQLDAEIDKILRMKALQERKPSAGPSKKIVDNLVEALKEAQTEGKKGIFPIEKFGKREELSKLKIGIVGAGISGLYTAHILKFLGIEYEILEANPDRLGGRVYTHHFKTEEPTKDPREDTIAKPVHDYYDIGAMRFPNSPIMARTFDLFKRLNMGEPGKPRHKDNVLIPYYMIGVNCPTRYNDITAYLGQHESERLMGDDGKITRKESGPLLPATELEDPFKVSTANGGTVPVSRVSRKVTAEILDDAYGRFRQKIKAAQTLTEEAKATKGDDAKVRAAEEARQYAYEYLMRHDKYSLRDYLQNVEGYDPETVHWIETTDSASGWFDMAFTENVLESLAFCYSDASNQKQGQEEKLTEWYCINGGTSITVERLVETLDKGKIFKGKVVNKMVLQDEYQDGEPPHHNVSVTMRDHTTNVEETRVYSAVINTTTLGALQKIDLTDMELPYGMKSAIRILRYDTSTKVGIKFKTMWWKLPQFGSIILGGVAKTDLPIRVCVYPSYNIHDPEAGPGVLLASYTWGQDSERIAAHVSNTSPDGDKGLRELMEYSLARLHTINKTGETKQQYEARFQENKQIIHDNWLDHHAYDWSKDEFSSGAFALFSPGQFSTLIPHLLRPASDGRFVIVGEHASANHAWIVGALDSALRGLKQILTRFDLQDKLESMIGEFGDVDELKQEQVAKQVIISMLTEEQMAELRLGQPVQAVGLVRQT